MKRKHANRLDWHRVIKKDFVSIFFDEEGFKGYITLIRIHKVTEPLIRKIADQEICLVDEGYYWSSTSLRKQIIVLLQCLIRRKK